MKNEELFNDGGRMIVRVLLCAAFFILHSSFFISCSTRQTPEEQAAQAALSYYNHLLDNRPAEFLDGRLGADSLPDDYRQQLVSAYNQYLADMVDKHGGLSGVEISPNVGRTDSTLHHTYAFLLLTFRDSTQEEITIPMVNDGERWLMK